MQYQHPGHGQPQPGGYQPHPAQAAGYGPPPVPPKKSSKLLLILAAAGVLLVVFMVVGGVAGWLLYKHFTKAGLPLDAKEMPANSTAVMEHPFSGADEKDPKKRKLYMAGALGSEVCIPGAGNPALRLEIATQWSLEQMMTEEGLRDAHQVMKCGSSMVDKLKAPSEIELSFKDGDDRLSVSFLELGIDALPADLGHQKFKFGEIAGHCFPSLPEASKPGSGAVGEAKDKKDDKECREDSFAAFKAGSRWVLGKRKAVALVAKSVASPADAPSTSVGFLEQAAASTTGRSMRVVTLMDESVKSPLQGLCSWGASASAGEREEFMKACFPEEDKLKKPIEALDAKVRAIALELDADLSAAEGVQGRMVFVARDADEAASLEKELNEVVSEWKAHVGNNESKLGKLAADNPKSSKEKVWRAAVDCYVRALKGMKVSRSGAALVLAFEEKFKDAERKEIAGAAETTGDEEKAVLAILEELIQGPKVSEASLVKLTGPEWAKWLLTPKVKLSPAECEKAEQTAKAVEISDLYADGVTDEVRKGLNQFRYGASLVCDSAIPKPYRDCVVKAGDWRALGVCQPPEAPSADKFGPPGKPDKKD